MDRRNFLQGILGGVTSAGLLITATPKEIELFGAPSKIGEEVSIKHEFDKTSIGIDAGQLVYNHKGQILGVITSLQVHRNMLDISSWKNRNQLYTPGGVEITATIKGFANVNVIPFKK